MRDEMVQELALCYAGYGLPQVAEHILKAYQNRGYESAIRQWASKTETLQANHEAYLPGYLAYAYTLLGDRDHAMYWLEQAYVHREMVSLDGGISFLGAEPIYDPLRSDSRFLDLERRVGL